VRAAAQRDNGRHGLLPFTTAALLLASATGSAVADSGRAARAPRVALLVQSRFAQATRRHEAPRDAGDELGRLV